MISIVIPAYNAEAYIAETVESILKQTYTDFEILVINDGSTDATEDILRALAKRDGRVRVICQEHSNAGVARNVGLDEAAGDHLLFFDADDIMKPNMLEIMLTRAQETEADITVCRSINFYESGEDEDEGMRNGPHHVDLSSVYSGRELGEHLFDSMIGWPWDKLYRAEFVKELGLRFQALGSTNDALFVFLSLAQANRISFVDRVLVRHRYHGGSISATRHVAPHNARAAYDAIVGAMKGIDNLTPEMWNAMLRWGISHMRWNYITMEGVARAEAFEDYKDLLEASADCGNLQLDEQDECARQVLLRHDASAEQIAVEQSFELQQLQRQLLEKIQKIEQLEKEIANYHEWTNQLEEALTNIEGSMSFKIGRAVTKLPRVIRDVGSHG